MILVKWLIIRGILDKRIGHDNKGLGAGWHLKEVLITCNIDGRQWICKCYQWLDKMRGDGKIVRDLVAVEKITVSMFYILYGPRNLNDYP